MVGRTAWGSTVARLLISGWVAPLTEQPEQGHQEQQSREDRQHSVVSERGCPVGQRVSLEFLQGALSGRRPGAVLNSVGVSGSSPAWRSRVLTACAGAASASRPARRRPPRRRAVPGASERCWPPGWRRGGLARGRGGPRRPPPVLPVSSPCLRGPFSRLAVPFTWLAAPETRPATSAALSRALAFTSVLATSASTVSPSSSRVRLISSVSPCRLSGGGALLSGAAPGARPVRSSSVIGVHSP